jgi:hypothetical protein
MPEQWISDMVGSEARPRAGFEDELAGKLQREWGGGRRPWRSMAWAAAAVLLVLGVVAFATRTSNGSVRPTDTVASTPATTPATTATPSTDGTTPATDLIPSTTISADGDGLAQHPVITVDDTTPSFGRTLVWTTKDPGGTAGWSASVTPSGRLFVKATSFDANEAGVPVYEIGPDGQMMQAFSEVKGGLISGPDERVYVADHADDLLQAYSQSSQGAWVVTSAQGPLGECSRDIQPTFLQCGAARIPVDPRADIASITVGPNFSISATAGDGSFARWNLQLDLHGVAVGDCTDDGCLVHRPYKNDGVAWTPYLVGSESRHLVVLLRPQLEPNIGWVDCGEGTCGIIGIAGDHAYAMSITPDGVTNIYKVHLAGAVPTGGVSGVVIGGTVALGARAALEANGLVVDAQPNIDPVFALAALRADVASGAVGPTSTVVFDVAMNRPITEAELDALIAELPEGATAAFVTMHAPVAWAAPNNDIIRSFVDRRGGAAAVLDWDAIVVDSELCSDGMHLSCNPAAIQRYAALLGTPVTSAVP